MRTSRKTVLRVLFTMAIVALLIVLGVRIQQRFMLPEATASRPLPVETIKLERQPFRAFITSVGTVTAERRIVISAQLNATVVEVPLREGARAVAGETLVRLDEDQARREVERLSAAAERARTDRDYWRKEAKADAELFKQGLLERRRMDDSRRQVATLEAAYRESLAALEIAKLKLEWANVTAPFDGYVQRNLVQPGEQVLPGVPLVELVAVSPLKVVAPVAEVDLPSLSEGQAAEVRLPQLGRTIETRVHQIYPALDPASRNATVELVLPMDADGVRPGMAAEVLLFTQLSPSSLVVPRQAVHHRRTEGNEVTGVFLLVDGKAHWQVVETGSAQGGEIQLLRGVRPGDIVITTPHPQLADGRMASSMSGKAAL